MKQDTEINLEKNIFLNVVIFIYLHKPNIYLNQEVNLNNVFTSKFLLLDMKKHVKE